MNEQQQAPKKRGCFFYGCITVLVLFVLLFLTGYFGTRYFVRNAIDSLTDEKPSALAKVSLPDDQMKPLQARIDSFKDALDNPKNGFELILSAQEMNALINNNTNFTDIKDSVFVRVEDDKVKADLSIPTDKFAELPLPFFSRFKGRYLNGSAGLKVSLLNGQLNVNLDSLNIKGQPVKGTFWTQFRSQNLAKDFANNPQTAASIAKFESIEIKDGKIIIKAKGAEKPDDKKPADEPKSDGAKKSDDAK